MAYDYSGYGIGKDLNNNLITEQSTYEDLERVLSFAIHSKNYSIENIFLWGFSLGTGPTVEIGSRYQNLGGVLLQSPLASIFTWLDSNLGISYDYTNGDIFCNIGKIGHIKSNIFIIHGKEDRIIDFRHSNLLYEKYKILHKKCDNIFINYAEYCGHNDIQILIEEPMSTLSKNIKKYFKFCLFKNKTDHAIKKSCSFL